MANSYLDDEMEDLEANAVVMLMAKMQELHMSDTKAVDDTDGLSQVHDLNEYLIHEIASPSASPSDREHIVQHNSSLSPQEHDQMNCCGFLEDIQIMITVGREILKKNYLSL